MPTGPDDIVRPFQLPNNTPGQLFLSQYQLAANTPIFVTPGFGASSSNTMPPLFTGTSHFECTVTFYCDAAQSELSS